MHEMSIVERFVDIAKEYAERNNAKSVVRLTLQVGGLTGVEPRYLTMFYPAVVKGTILEGSELVVEAAEAAVFCTSCAGTYNPLNTDGKCPKCGDDRCDIIEGNNILVKEISIIPA